MEEKSKLILGTVQFGLDYGINNSQGKPSDDEVKAILDFAYRSGVRLLDTAEAYGNSQERIGCYHKFAGEKFDIITKFNGDKLVSDIKERIFKDMKQLGVSELYAYMFHSYTQYLEFFPIFEKDLLELKEQGIIKKIGVSVYTNEEIEGVLLDEKISLIQVPFNLFDNEKQRGKLLEKAKNKGVEVHTRSAFLQGLFFCETTKLSGNLVNIEEELNTLNNIVQDNNNLKTSLALNYPLSKPYIDKMLIGVDNVEQLKKNLEVVSMEDESMQTLFNKVDSLEVKEKALLNPSNWKK